MNRDPDPAGPALAIEEAFRRARQELQIRVGFPEEVLREAEQVAQDREPLSEPGRNDRRDVPFVTIDPAGSRDLDQAVHAERTTDGYRIRYAIADVGFWVDRNGLIEKEAWRRGVTFYAPDHRETLYPPVLSHGAASLLAGETRPAIVFDLDLGSGAELQSWSLESAAVQSREQLTYAQLLAHAEQGGTPETRGEAWSETLSLLAEIGRKRLQREMERGGVSLPVRDQHVQQQAAAALGYELVYEEPNAAEQWNAQVSLLTGHAAATRMLDARVGLLRTMPAFQAEDVEKFRRIARTLGFSWPEGKSYTEFMHGLDLDHPHIEALTRQARRVMRGADYTAFRGEPPDQPLHGALAFTYSHVTAPLRRLADRYVLDLLVALESGRGSGDAEIAILHELPEVMGTARRKENQLERRVVDIAEAWTLRDRVGDVFPAVVIDARGAEVEVQIEEPPIRTSLRSGTGSVPELGERLTVRLVDVKLVEGRVHFEIRE